jgi:molecular chaperone DnaJ
MQQENYYKILGVEKTATDEEIKKAYKKLVFELHPDRNQQNKTEAEEKLKKVTEAYGVLSSKEKRAEYDNPSPYHSIFATESEFVEWLRQNSDGFFNFDQQKTQRRPSYGFDAPVVMLTMQEVIAGVSKTIPVQLRIPCDCCIGSGFDASKPKQTCKVCSGKGNISMPMVGARIQCHNCNGTGQAYASCDKCNGECYLRQEKNITINIKPGAKHNNRITCSTEHGGKKFEGYVVVAFDPNSAAGCKIDQNGNVYKDLELNYAQLALGGTKIINMLNGDQKTIKIPAGTNIGQMLRVKGEGLPHHYGSTSRGDLIYNCSLKQIKLENISDAEKELLEKLRTIWES